MQQVVAAHAGLARNAGSDDHDVGVGGGGVVVRADDVHIALLDRHGFEQVERFALGHAFDNIDQHHVGQFLGGNPVCGRGADVAGADNGYFLTHDSPLIDQSSQFEFTVITRISARRTRLELRTAFTCFR